MPASFVAEMAFRLVFETILYVVGYATGWLLVPTLTLGYYTADPVPPPNPRKYKNRGLPRAQRGPRSLSFEATTAIGILFWVVVGAIATFFWLAAKP